MGIAPDPFMPRHPSLEALAHEVKARGSDIRGENSGERDTCELAVATHVVLQAGDSVSGRLPADGPERAIPSAIEGDATGLQGFFDAAQTSAASVPSVGNGCAIQVVFNAGIHAAASGEFVVCDMIDEPAAST